MLIPQHVHSMSFRKRNVALGVSTGRSTPVTPDLPPKLPPGVRPSPLDGRPTTSTGTQTLDDLLGGHNGFPLGHSLLIEENGTTDFAGSLLRFYAAQGVVQGHQVHVVGVPEQWGHALPGMTGGPADGHVEKESMIDQEKMKIAWRYERLGEFGKGREGRKGMACRAHFSMVIVPYTSEYLYRTTRSLLGTSLNNADRNPVVSPLPDRGPSSQIIADNPSSTTAIVPLTTNPLPFIHTFDLTKRLTPLSISPPINYISLSTSSPNAYNSILTSLSHSLSSSSPDTIHRLIIPTLLSPLIYPPSSNTTQPTSLLPFLHSLRSLLRQHPTRLTAMVTLPLSLHPRSQGLTRWIEHLMDGVLELAPFPYSVQMESLSPDSGGGGGEKEEKAQGMFKVHRLPVRTEKGAGVAGGGGGGGEDLAFVLSRRRFVIRPFWLPPVEGEQDIQGSEGEGEW